MPQVWLARGRFTGLRQRGAEHHYVKLTLGLASILGMALAGCSLSRSVSPAGNAPGPVISADALLPSPRLIVGRVIAVNALEGFAFVELAPDAPASAWAEGSELIVRTAVLQETGRLHASRQLRGRTLGARIVAGQPTPGDEVLWLAP